MTLSLPADPSALPADDPVDGKRATLLVVDDSVFDRQVVAELLGAPA